MGNDLWNDITFYLVRLRLFDPRAGEQYLFVELNVRLMVLLETAARLFLMENVELGYDVDFDLLGCDAMWTCRYQRFGGKYCLHLQPRRWRQYVPPKRWYLCTYEST
jgi:hypothetical protein